MKAKVYLFKPKVLREIKTHQRAKELAHLI